MIRCALALLIAATGSPALAAPPQPVVETVAATARAAGFDGAILLGEADGSAETLTLGADPVQPDAVWRWASITKQLAAVIAAQEIARGRLDPEATVATYWPDWAAPHAKRIRIRELLNHQSGLPQPDESPTDKDGVPAFYRSAASTPPASAAGFCAGPARAAPPAKFHYNNCDTIVLAEVLARITGKPFEELVRDRIARPLGLKSFGLYGLGARPRHVAPTGEEAGVDPLINLGVGGASSSAYGTIADLWTFDRALLDGRLLDAAARERMWTASADNGFLNAYQWTYSVKLKGCKAPVRIVERQGLIGGIELRNWLLPESKRGLILFSRKRPTKLGDPWEGRGMGFDLLSAVACRP